MSDGDQRGRLHAVAVDARGRVVRTPGLTRWLVKVAPAHARGLVSIALVSDARVRALNRQYRRQDYATDVLSFPAHETLSPQRTPRTQRGTPERERDVSSVGRTGWNGGMGRKGRIQRRGATGGARARLQPIPPVQPLPPVQAFLGDIVIARGVARRQARGARHSELTELRVLALHGLLHLLGYDHEDDGGGMRRLEERLRRKGGLRAGLIERADASAQRTASRREPIGRVDRGARRP